jgi:hypothetical protein
MFAVHSEAGPLVHFSAVAAASGLRRCRNTTSAAEEAKWISSRWRRSNAIPLKKRKRNGLAVQKYPARGLGVRALWPPLKKKSRRLPVEPPLPSNRERAHPPNFLMFCYNFNMCCWISGFDQFFNAGPASLVFCTANAAILVGAQNE